MAIKKSFNGTTLLKPGAYSKIKVDNSAGSDLGQNDTIFLVGESTKGPAGSVTGIQEFSASRLDTLIQTFGEGPLVDAAVAAVRPSVTPGVGGAGKILVYKTNASVQAGVSVLAGATPIYTVKDRAYGIGGNKYILKVEAGSIPEPLIKKISVLEIGGTTEVLGTSNIDPWLTVTYTGDATTGVLDIAGASRALLTLTTTLAADQTDGSANLSIPLTGLTLSDLVATINASVGYTATLDKASKSGQPVTELDLIAALDIKAGAKPVRAMQAEIRDLINTSVRVVAVDATVDGNVPTNADLPLLGGLQGASTNSTFSTGLSVSLAKDYSVVLPCISRDAATDIADAVLGFTDATSTYTLSSVLAATTAHLILRGSTKNRKEAQGWGGVRKALKADAFSTIAGLNDYNMQVTMQDCVFLDANGSLRIGQPHVLAALMAGIRLGTPVGEPLTFKFLNVQQVGHKIDPVTLLDTGDFNSGLDADEAIENGVAFAEKRGAGYRIVLDNTTYGFDGSFLFNRGSVIEASYYVNKTLRALAEELFIGKKVSNGIAQSVKSAVRNKLRELNQPEVQIITASTDAPEGFREDTFVVTLNGNCLEVQVEYKPVQSVDFVKFNFTIGDIQQIA